VKVLSVLWSNRVKTGAHKRLLYLLRGLAGRGHEVTLITKRGHDHEAKGIHTIEVQSGSLPSSKLDSLWSLITSDINEKVGEPDIIVCFGLGSVTPGIYLKRLTGSELLFGLRAYPIKNVVKENPLKQGVYRVTNSVYLALGLRAASRIVVQVDSHKEILVSKHQVGEEQIDVIHNNILTELESVSLPDKPKELLFVGTLNKRKGIDDLLRAFNGLARSKRDLRLHLAGDGPLRRWAESYVSREGLSSQVIFYGFVGNVRELMAACDLVVVPSRVDTFPNVCLEAMSTGTPFIISDLEEVRSAFGDATEYFSPSDPVSLRDKLQRLLNKESYSELKSRCLDGRDRFVFDWVDAFESVMEKTIDRRSVSTFQNS